MADKKETPDKIKFEGGEIDLKDDGVNYHVFDQHQFSP